MAEEYTKYVRLKDGSVILTDSAPLGRFVGPADSLIAELPPWSKVLDTHAGRIPRPESEVLDPDRGENADG